MTNDNTGKQIVLNLTKEILDIATDKQHSWNNNQYADFEADNSTYGHVKKASNLNENNDDAVPSVSLMKTYVNNVISNNAPDIADFTEYEQYKNYNEQSESKLIQVGHAKIIEEYIQNQINTLNTSINGTNGINNNINYLNNNFNNYITKEPQETDIYIDNLTQAGYFIYNRESTLEYNDDVQINLYQSLIQNETNNDSIIQYITIAEPIIDNNTQEMRYELTGEKYFRVYPNTNNKWGALSLLHKPTEKWIANIDDEQGTIEIIENTTGYIIKWSQNAGEYIVKKDLYEYTTLVDLSTEDSLPYLDIGDCSYIFGNLIGKIDVKITSDKIEVRSTLPKGDKVKNVTNVSFFVPRLENYE